MKYFITYADDRFKKQGKFSLRMAKLLGGFDSTRLYNPSDISPRFYELHKHILKCRRGGGYWLWKAYIINKTIKEVNHGDYVFYSDSGAFFLKNVDVLINELKLSGQDIMGFELPLIESQWTKKELFINMNCCDSKSSDSNQLLASFILIKKTDFSVRFFDDFLDFCCQAENINDVYDDQLEQNNDFIDHRHDQSIFSLLYKKCNLKPFKDPSQFSLYPWDYGKGGVRDTSNTLHILSNGRKFRFYQYDDRYNLVLFHSRGSPPIKTILKFIIKYLFYKMNIAR